MNVSRIRDYSLDELEKIIEDRYTGYMLDIGRKVDGMSHHAITRISRHLSENAGGLSLGTVNKAFDVSQLDKCYPMTFEFFIRALKEVKAKHRDRSKINGTPHDDSYYSSPEWKKSEEFKRRKKLLLEHPGQVSEDDRKNIWLSPAEYASINPDSKIMELLGEDLPNNLKTKRKNGKTAL